MTNEKPGGWWDIGFSLEQIQKKQEQREVELDKFDTYISGNKRIIKQREDKKVRVNRIITTK